MIGPSELLAFMSTLRAVAVSISLLSNASVQPGSAGQSIRLSPSLSTLSEHWGGGDGGGGGGGGVGHDSLDPAGGTSQTHVGVAPHPVQVYFTGSPDHTHKPPLSKSAYSYE